MLAIAEIGEADRRDVVLDVGKRQPQLGVLPARGFFLEVPLALLAPAEADRAFRHDDRAAGLVIGERLPLRIVGLAAGFHDIGRADEALRHIMRALLHQPHQHRHVGVLAGVVLEILGLPVDMEFAQDDVAHGHAERGIGALLRRHPQIGEFRGFRIVRADHDALGAAVARLGIEMRVGRARLRHVRAPQHAGSPNCTSRRFRERRSARPRSAGDDGGRSQYQS